MSPLAGEEGAEGVICLTGVAELGGENGNDQEAKQGATLGGGQGSVRMVGGHVDHGIAVKVSLLGMRRTGMGGFCWRAW